MISFVCIKCNVRKVYIPVLNTLVEKLYINDVESTIVAPTINERCVVCGELMKPEESLIIERILRLKNVKNRTKDDIKE